MVSGDEAGRTGRGAVDGLALDAWHVAGIAGDLPRAVLAERCGELSASIR
eukprot:CAMPEP_0204539338 /NCGR_PEP_ID=MMETSP0661-20131031/16655_1 /ASSEMBLY_ACC=CAM_ASM_000606 /TAXON_ID=109239 /ORGANISM="Alexandrium margalefi, Strain AMGDE01CS-322" /LENGTH=49 /DNA_ID= /DNA_START= /DNA_END= /DNA_ORIENTATION=